MDRVELETGSAPIIHIEHVGGNLRIKGWDRNLVRADCNSDEGRVIDQTEEGIQISSTSGCMLRVPMDANLQIEQLDGDLMVKSAEGQITVKQIKGQIMAKSVGMMDLTEVLGAINARGIEGGFICKNAGGNINLQDIEGKVSIDNASGNLVVKGYCGSISAQVKGNATLKIDPISDQDYLVKSKGNLFCRLEPDVSASINLKSGSGNIKVQEDQNALVLDSNNHEIVTGDGATSISLEAVGEVELVLPGENEFDWEFELNLEKDLSAMAENITMVVTDQLETQLDALGDHLNNLSDNLSTLNPEISDKTRARIEAKRAKLERKLAKVERRAAEKSRQSTRRVARKFTMNVPQSDPVSDEERQKVLEMLQNKLISVEDAEALLAALEGK
jgi:DUF4097 and DUF4098 domain-containing protein YvlB